MEVSVFSKNLRKERRKKNWTQDELAEKADISLSAVQAYEYGTSSPRFNILIKLLRTLDIKFEDLCTAE